MVFLIIQNQRERVFRINYDLKNQRDTEKQNKYKEHK